MSASSTQPVVRIARIGAEGAAAPARSPWASLPIVLGAFSLIVGGLGTLVPLARFWEARTEHSDRLLILLGSGWLAWNARPRLQFSSGNWLFLPLILFGGVAMAPAWYLYAQVASRVILLWWLTAAWISMAAGAILLAGGWSSLRLLAFPLLFVFLALPIPERFELPLQERLKRVTTDLAEMGLRASGFTVHRNQFELHLPSGGLEVVEACSGVRSVTALLAIAVFVAHMRGFGLLRGLLMLGMAFPVIAAVNALRIILTGWIQETAGPQYVQGTPHEILGIAMVLVGLCMVVLLSQVLRPRLSPANETTDAMPAEKPDSRVSTTPSSFKCWIGSLTISIGVGVALYTYLTGENRVVKIQQDAPLEKVPLEIRCEGGTIWTGQEMQIPEQVTEMLTYDKAICRVYRDEFGREIQVWAIFWQTSASIRGYHHPDICFPNRGYQGESMPRQTIELSGGRQLPVTVRLYQREREQKRLYHWTQEGRRVWSEEDEARADRGGPGHNWIRDRLVAHPPEMSARLSVLLVSEVWGRNNQNEKLLEDFTRQFAERLYEVCPWADLDTASR